MPAPSRRTGISAAFFGLAVAVILVAGFALGPRAFEFRAWPQPSPGGAVEQVVVRPSAAATEVPVVRVRRGERDRARSRAGALSARGRNARGDRLASRGVTLDARSRARRGESGSRRGGSGRAGGPGAGPETAPPVVVIVDETPAPVTDAPVDQLAEQPAQLAEVPPKDQVLRPEAHELGSVPDQDPQLQADGFLGEVDRLVDSLLPGESRDGRRGSRHGRR